MRVTGAILLTIFLLIGTYYYAAFADSVRREPVQLTAKMDSGVWKIELTRTFDCLPDTDSEIAALLVELKGKAILKRENKVPASEKIVVNDVVGIEQGTNEILATANLAALDDFEFSFAEEKHALRVAVYRGTSLIADQTFWSREGETSISETVIFEAPVDDSGQSNHGHQP